MHHLNAGEITVQGTIELITSNNSEDVCDDSCRNFKNYENLPLFYDEEKFKRGQEFYHKHIFAMFFAKLLGLITVISTPNILKILIFTNMSSEPMTAYKRYMATIFHMCVWYDNDFKPGSKLWNSIATVKTLHNSASKRSCAANGLRILQKDMAITQFGFMGYAVVCPQLIGIHNASKKELEGFIHLWRVVGYIMGIDDRYNICKETLIETKEICEALMNNVFVPNINNQDPEYLKMADTLIKGMWAMEPTLYTKTFLTYMHSLLSNNLNNNYENKLPIIKLTLTEKIMFQLMTIYIFCLKFTLVRWFNNAKQYLAFWLMRNFPFLAIYKYGYENSFVSIYIRREKSPGNFIIDK